MTSRRSNRSKSSSTTCLADWSEMSTPRDRAAFLGAMARGLADMPIAETRRDRFRSGRSAPPPRPRGGTRPRPLASGRYCRGRRRGCGGWPWLCLAWGVARDKAPMAPKGGLSLLLARALTFILCHWATSASSYLARIRPMMAFDNASDLRNAALGREISCANLPSGRSGRAPTSGRR